MRNLHRTYFFPLIIVVVILLLTTAYLFQTYQSATISGQVDLNGVAPDKSTISVLGKKDGEASFRPLVQNLATKDVISWVWNGGIKGVSYQVKAVLQSNDKTYGESQVLNVLAPATGEVLTINSSYKPSPQQAAISGGIDLNGSVAGQSGIALYQKKVGEENFTVVTDKIQAVDGASWSWNDAVAGEQYELKATLFVNGEYMGESAVIKVTAPASNEMLRINSQYSPPPEKATISGSFDINGPIPSNTTVSVYKQGQNDSSYVKLFDMAASNGIQWSWNNAIQGAKYNMKATLWNNGKDIGDSQVITLSAPADNEVFHISYSVSGNATVQPPNSPNAVCTNQQGNSWTVNLSFQSVAGANTYWLQVGSQSGGNNVLDTKIGSNGQTTQSYSLGNINNGSTYFARYAASTCVNCSNSSQYSPFSNILQFSCTPQSPTATPTLYPPQPTYTPFPTSTPYPTNTPTISS